MTIAIFLLVLFATMTVGVPIAFALMLTALALLTSKPAALLGLDCGRLAKGAPADLVLFHPQRGWKVEAGKLPGKAQNSPFDGRALEGRVLGTWKAGRRVFGA